MSIDYFVFGDCMEKKTSLFYKFLKALVKLFYGKKETVGWEKMPEEPSIIVGNHSQLNGPLAGELYLPGKRYIWCAREMMHIKEVPAYAYRDFWEEKPKIFRPFFKLASYLIAPISVVVFNNAHTIAVNRGLKIIATYKETVEKLEEGYNIVIFPEHAVEHNNIVYEFQRNFIDSAKYYYKKTGKEVNFVPLYIAPKLKKMYVGDAIKFDSSNDIEEEKTRICNHLMDEITNIARNLPEHTVIPYKNLPKKLYKKNTETEGKYEETGC